MTNHPTTHTHTHRCLLVDVTSTPVCICGENIQHYSLIELLQSKRIYINHHHQPYPGLDFVEHYHNEPRPLFHNNNAL